MTARRTRAAARSGGTGPEVAERLVVVLGDQLDSESAVLRSFDPARDQIAMFEVREESTHVPSHVQRTVLFLSAMRHFAAEQSELGRRVRYTTLDDPKNTGSFDGEVARAVRETGAGAIALVLPGEHRVHAMAGRWSRTLGVKVEIAPDRHFLTTPEEFEEWSRGKKETILEYFYRWQRKRLGALVDDDGKPLGGQWNYDHDNRLSFKATPRIPKPKSFPADTVTREVIEVVRRTLPDLPGRVDANAWRWPVTRHDALAALDDFVAKRLKSFGPYEDAMWTNEPFVYHALLSPAMNLKLLDPREIWPRAVRALEKGKAPMASVEGFVRQIIGWREFIRGVYWREGPEYGERNALDQHGELPAFYWSGQTDMNCMRQCIGQVLEHGFGHHIQRLMVTGNFALIAGVHPRRVSDWYLGMYVDAVDWVTLPNTLGMSQHADGGVVGTKPYAASGKYIQRMSNYCDGCRYDPAKRTGDDACPFNTFYWDFLIRTEGRFARNPRMTMILKNVQRLSRAERVEITVHGRRLREEMGIS